MLDRDDLLIMLCQVLLIMFPFFGVWAVVDITNRLDISVQSYEYIVKESKEINSEELDYYIKQSRLDGKISQKEQLFIIRLMDKIKKENLMNEIQDKE